LPHPVRKGRTFAVALLAGATFPALAALASSRGGTVGNLPLAALQVALTLSR